MKLKYIPEFTIARLEGLIRDGKLYEARNLIDRNKDKVPEQVLNIINSVLFETSLLKEVEEKKRSRGEDKIKIAKRVLGLEVV